jgi:mannose-6-phosphate isomerase-like protein (cupin superfamily)
MVISTEERNLDSLPDIRPLFFRLGRQETHLGNGQLKRHLLFCYEGKMNLEKITISEKFSKLPSGDYAVGLIAKMNNYEFKIVKFKGDFVWHSHSETDETFIIVEGTMVMNFRDRKIEVNAGEMIVIPKGVEHKPSSEKGYKAILIEPEGVPNTGDVQSERTINKIEWV